MNSKSIDVIHGSAAKFRIKTGSSDLTKLLEMLRKLIDVHEGARYGTDERYEFIHSVVTR